MPRILLLLAVLTLAAQPLRAEEPDGWKLMLQRNYEELQYQIDYVDGVSQNLPGMVKQTRQDLAALRKKLDELMVMARVSGSSPTELRAVLAGLEILKSRVESVTQPFLRADSDLKNFQERLGELEAEFSRQGDGPSQDVNKALGDFLGDLRKLKGKLGRVKTVLDQGLNPTRDLQGNIGKISQAITERIPRAWKDYYLSQGKGLMSVSAWTDGLQRLTDLPRLGSVYLALFDAGGADLREALWKFLGLAAMLVLLAAAGLKRLEGRLPGFRVTDPLGSLVWAALGGSLIWATSGPAFVLARAETSALGEILIARGVLGLSWFLRGLTAKDGPEADRGVNPAAGAWWLFALALTLQVPWLPEAPRGVVWVLALLAAGWLARRGGGASSPAEAGSDRALPGQGGGATGVMASGEQDARALESAVAGPPVSRAASTRDPVAALARAGGWLYPLLCLPAVLGWVNLTMLLAMAWFLALVFLQAGLGLHGLVSRAVERPAADLPGEVWRSLAGGLALPLVAIAMAGAFLFWLSLAMGGKSVFWTILASDVGDADVNLDLGRVAAIFMGFYLARGAVRVADRVIASIGTSRPDLERGVLNLLETVSTYLIWGVYALTCLRLVGASMTSLAVVAGGLSVGIGFGMQNIINNFISGLILLFGRSVQAGDTLQIGETWGTVSRVNIRNTVVQTNDNATLFVPNSDLIAQKILNWSHKDRRVRRSFTVSLAHGTEPAQARELLLRAAREHPNVLADPKPVAHFKAFTDTGLSFRLFFWLDDLDNSGKALSDIQTAADTLFKENGLRFPGGAN